MPAGRSPCPGCNLAGIPYDSGDYLRGLELAVSRIGYEAVRARQEAWRREGRWVGVGVSCYVEFTTAADLPKFELDHLETPSPVTTFGVKGVGEGGTIAAAAAVSNAICDALAPYGVELDRLPVTAEAVWRALQAARRRSGGADADGWPGGVGGRRRLTMAGKNREKCFRLERSFSP